MPIDAVNFPMAIKQATTRGPASEPFALGLRGAIRIQSVVVGAGLGLAAAVWGVWLIRQTKLGPRAEPTVLAPQLYAATLSPATEELLHRLSGKVSLHYYAILDRGPEDEPLRSFSTRVTSWLATYEKAAAGKLEIVRTETRLPEHTLAAAKDGLTPLHINQGDPCYFGIVVACEGRKEVLPSLKPEWAAAFESDLSRAIERVAWAAPTARANDVNAPLADSNVIASVKRQVPGFDSLSLDEGIRRLRESSLKQLEALVQKTDADIKALEQQLASEPTAAAGQRREVILEELKRLQALQTEKLQEISARSLAEIETLRRLKSSTR